MTDSNSATTGLRSCRRRASLWWLPALLVAAAGCGGADEDLPPTAPVSGSVLYNGVPLSSGAVSFYPESGERSSGGVIGSDGTFRLSTFDQGDGAIVGKHKVAVSSTKASSDGGISMESAIPAKYADRLTSPLTFEVKQGENTFQIELVD